MLLATLPPSFVCLFHLFGLINHPNLSGSALLIPSTTMPVLRFINKFLQPVPSPAPFPVKDLSAQLQETTCERDIAVKKLEEMHRLLGGAHQEIRDLREKIRQLMEWLP